MRALPSLERLPRLFGITPVSTFIETLKVAAREKRKN